ncbi:type IV pilus assembly protein PilQ [Aquimarina sp. EL_43]|uniref:type II secretion system protein GspD n=1 Tax=unclassified Aquimarina TaxID=2627091 RepID=UPI0018CAC921|nr:MULTISPECIES: type II and III secretion system protein [unclassified Aquimarina]MBG6130625.1 type IV pilus assembly protein PilQ [Aquimarina sp. EL_35]MBG6151229.1 type IV pilus assembly protein PilQ [Aquimarina sp. EL_32]MBG6169027.1 type IV pilus assembly protein PilQ [Aquimarina sp. EL_43]
MKKFLYYIVLVCIIPLSYGQQDMQKIEEQINAYAEETPELNETIQIDVSGLTLYDFLTSVAIEHKLNISADQDLNQIVSSSFFNVPVKDVFLFVIKKYNLSIEFINKIIVFKKTVKPKELPKPKVLKEIDVTYNSQNDFLAIKLKNDSLPRVAKKITDVSGKNVILGPNVKNEKVSAYILNRPFDQVMEMMAKSNKLIVTKDDNGFYYVEKDQAPAAGTATRSSRKGKKTRGPESSAEITVLPSGFLSVQAFDADITSLILEAAEKLNVNYFMYDKPAGATTTLVVNEITFDELLDHVFMGKNSTYKKTDDFYLIGDQNGEGLRSTELIQLENRTIETVLETLPKDLIENVELKEFIELNGFVVSGSRPRILELKEYIKQIDKVVPMILIEVLIVQYQKGYDIQTGIKAGIDKKERVTSGALFPQSEVTINSSSVNKLIDAFNGFGIFNLGKVAKDFYLSLKALENNSIIRLQSTPKISTLSGHEAKISIGETNYYFEQNNRLINNGVSSDILQSGQWKATDANLSVNIKPFVSKDEQITLTIVVEKSAFLGRAGENAPPGKSTQQFESLVRVRNGEMILLGGLDELEKENSGTGTPVLSRIPIIKWFFSSKTKKKKKSKLHVFIKPTVVY